MKEFMESTIPKEVDKIFARRNYGWNDFCTEAVTKVIFEGAAIFLSKYKSKDNPVAILFKDLNNEFVFGAYVQFHKGEETEEGSWTLNYTFDKNDIDEKNWKIYSFPDDQVTDHTITDLAYSKYGIVFKFKAKDDNDRICEGSSQDICATILDVIHRYMKANVSNDPQLHFDKYFMMTAELNGETVYVGIESSALLKQFVKDDSTSAEKEDKSNATIPERVA